MDGTKRFYEMQNVGRARYTVSFHDGVQTHRDGSAFYGIRIFGNKRDRDRFVRALVGQGFKQA